MASTINVSDELKKIAEFGQSNAEFDRYINLLIDGGQIKNPFQLATFSFWTEGFITTYQIHSFAAATFIFFWSFVLPIVAVAFGINLVTMISLIFVERIRKEYQYKTLKAVGKWGMYSSFLVFAVCAITFIILIAFLEKQFDKVSLLDQGSKSFGSAEYQTDHTRINSFNFFLNGTLATMFGNGLIHVDSRIIDSTIINTNMLITTNIFLAVLIPISLICTISFSSIWIATFISNRNNGLSKFSRWLGNVRIDSRREFAGVILRNWWFWILAACFLVTIIYPGLVHDYQTGTQITIAVVSLVLLPVCFIPLFIAIYKIFKIRMFNYNKMMFAQILCLSITTTSLQVIIWALFGEQIMGPAWLMIGFPLLTIITSILCTFGFIKWKS
ncbi:hypothetical protein SCLARK_001031 [Spiroplasma clarkii]|nr:hypothetical protein SCLARK_001031 [Spiroplasma clarkii]